MYHIFIYRELSDFPLFYQFYRIFINFIFPFFIFIFINQKYYNQMGKINYSSYITILYLLFGNTSGGHGKRLYIEFLG